MDPEPNMRVEHARLRAGMTRDELAALAGVSATTIRRIEVGSQHRTKMDCAEAIARALEQPIPWLFADTVLTTQGRYPGDREPEQDEPIRPGEALCPSCYILGPVVRGECGACGSPIDA